MKTTLINPEFKYLNSWYTQVAVDRDGFCVKTVFFMLPDYNFVQLDFFKN